MAVRWYLRYGLSYRDVEELLAGLLHPRGPRRGGRSGRGGWTGASASNRPSRAEADHARLKARLRPMRGLKQFRSAARIATGHAFVQNLRRGHYELGADAAPPLRLATAFTELPQTM